MSALANNYKRKNISFVKGKGSYLITKNGAKYLDFVQGIAVNSLGHSNRKLIKALNKQSTKLWHVSNAFKIPEGEQLAKKLVKRSFADSIIFQNSGRLYSKGIGLFYVIHIKEKLGLFNWDRRMIRN